MPTSAATSAAISSPRSASAALIAVQASTRDSTGTWRQASKPARAASTARSTSSGVPSGIRPITFSVVESITSIVPAAGRLDPLAADVEAVADDLVGRMTGAGVAGAACLG